MSNQCPAVQVKAVQVERFVVCTGPAVGRVVFIGHVPARRQSVALLQVVESAGRSGL